MENEFTIYGASGHGKVVIEIVEAMGGKITRVIDDNASVTALLGYPVSDQYIFNSPVIVTIGNNTIRKTIAEKLDAAFGTAIHPRSIVSTRAMINSGSVIMAGATVNSDVSIGSHCIINTNASVDHDCVLADFVHVSPNASLGGNVTVGEGTHIGIGSTVIQGIKIGKWCVIGAGSAIIKDVPDHAVVVGVPGKVIKYTKE